MAYADWIPDQVRDDIRYDCLVLVLVEGKFMTTVVAFLASAEPNFITGQAITVDGFQSIT